jgi:hypothetical protein
VESDLLLRRVGHTAILVCLVMTAIALVLSRQPLSAAMAVLGGGLIAGTSYLAIQSGVNALAERLMSPADSAARRPALRWTMVKVIGRYALLAFLTYVMIARLRLPPLGLLAGASSVVAAVSIEAVRLLMKKESASRT